MEGLWRRRRQLAAPRRIGEWALCCAWRGGVADGLSRTRSDEEEAPRKLVRANNFQGETGTIDVDAHMLAYIEAEMASRRAASSAAAGPSSASAAAAPTAADVARASGNPEDELYRIAERYRKIQDEARKKEMKKENEGGVSAAMLSGVVEVDLGME